MNDVLEEVTSETITREDVIKRLDDWVARLNGLYDHVESWLPAGWRAERSNSLVMDEELMRKFAVPARDVPLLVLSSVDGRHATLEPRGLWIVGINGRVDLFDGDKHYLIVDVAQNFSKPNWCIADFAQRDNFKALDQIAFQAALTA